MIRKIRYTAYPFLITAVLNVLAITPSFSQSAASFLNPYPTNISPSSLLEVAVNNSSGIQRVYIEGTINDFNSNNVLHLHSGIFMLQTGRTILSQANIPGLVYGYSNKEVETYTRQHGKLPVNDYTICLTIYYFEGTRIFAKVCMDFHPVLRGPELISPFNNEHILTPLPTLTWHGIMQGEIFNSSYYDIRIVELFAGQPLVAAINENPVVYYETGIYKEFIKYPVNAKELEKGKSYAWQVTAYDNNTISGKTEVWAFTIDSIQAKASEIQPPILVYAALTSSPGGTYINCTNIIRFKLDGHHSLSNAGIRIYTASRKDVTPSDLHLDRSYGDNRYAIDLTHFRQFKHNRTYSLELQTDRGETLKMNFKYFRNRKNYPKKQNLLIHKEY